MRLASVRRRPPEDAERRSTFPASRRARTAWTRPTCLRSSAGSMCRIGCWLVVALGVPVDADDDPPSGVDLALQLVGRVGDLALGEVLLDRLDHPAELVDAREVRVGRAPPSRRSAPRRSSEPPSGSIVLATPVSWAMICWVRSAMRTASSVGSASASS